MAFETKKIIVVQSLFPALSATFILDQMIGLINRGFEIENWATRKSDDKLIHPAVLKYDLLSKTKYIKVPNKSLITQHQLWLEDFKKINSISSFDDVFAFHVHYGNNYNFLEPLFNSINKCVVVSFHGHDASRAFKIYGNDCYKNLFKRADQITTPSYFMKNELVKRGCPDNKINIHRYGIDIQSFSKEKNKFPTNKITFLTVGRFVEKKGIEYSIKAFAKIKDSVNAEYLIIGEGPRHDIYKKLVKKLGLEDSVKFLGPKTKEDVLKYMKASDIFILTSVTAGDGDSEGVPVALTEAQAVGLPVVSTFHAGIPELVKNNKSGLLSNEKDVTAIASNMLSLALNERMREEYSSNAVEIIHNEFDIEKLNDQLAIYFEDINEKSKSNQFNFLKKSFADIEILKQNLTKINWLNKFELYESAFQSVEFMNVIDMPVISVIVIAWKYNDDILPNLKELKSQKNHNYELIFVDNGGSENEFDSLKPFIDTYVKLNHNTGAYFARNVGSVFANSKILFFLDDDALPHKDLLSSHINSHKEFDIISVRGAVFPKTKNPMNGAAGHYYLGEKTFPCYSTIEGNTSYDAEIFFKVGGWDDSIIFGGGGVELALRLTAFEPDQRKQIYSPYPVIYHDYSKNENHFESKQKRQGESRKRIRQKYPDYDDFIFSWDKFYNQENYLIRKGNKKTEPVFFNPFISICIPSYNREKFISDAVNSALNNSYDNYEVLVCDDGSTDNSVSILKKFSDIKLKVIRKPHTNAPDTRNTLIENAKGDYILWLDSDDILEKDALNEYVKFVNLFPHVDIFYCNQLVIDCNTKTELQNQPSEWYRKNNLLLHSLVFYSPIPNPGVLIKKSLYKEVGGYNVEFHRAHDYEFFVRAASCNKYHFKRINKTLVKYRIHQNNLTGFVGNKTDFKYEAKILTNLITVNFLRDLFFNFDWDNQPNESLAKAYFIIGLRYLNYQNYDKGIEMLIESVVRNKMEPEYEKLILKIMNTGSFKGKYELLYLLNQLPNEDSDKLITEYLDKFKILLSTNDFENAIVTLEKLFSAISQFQTSLINAEQIYCFKGKVFLMMKRIEEAQASFEYALTINPESSEACEGLGNVFLMTGQYDNAKTMMEWAVKNCPTNLYAVDSLEKINTTVANQMSQNFV